MRIYLNLIDYLMVKTLCKIIINKIWLIITTMNQKKKLSSIKEKLLL